MPDQPNPLESRVARLDESVDRLTTEFAALKLELATLVSALQETHFQHLPGRRPSAPATPTPPEASTTPSIAPAAIVVLLATGLLSWQLIMGPRPYRGSPPPPQSMVADARASLAEPPHVTVPAAGPEALIVKPMIYKGTLAINADRPGATVFVNRKNVGTAPVRLPNLKAGSHLVWVESDGYRRWTRVVTVPAEQVTRVSVDLEPIEPIVEP